MILLLVVIVAIVLGAIALIVWFGHSSTPGTNGSSGAATNGAPGDNGSSTTPAAGASPAGGGQSGATITIHLLTPISGNVWTIGQANPIAWDNAADITGEIDLVNANTKAFIGVILAETGPKQTSYTWDAREVYLGRYSADEVAVIPGVYSIRIHFDGNGLDDLISGPITITN